MKFKFEPETFFSITPDVLYIRKGPEKVILVDLKNLAQRFEIEREYIVLWDLIDGRSTADDIVKKMQRRTKKFSDSVGDKVYEILDVFMDLGLIRIVNQ